METHKFRDYIIMGGILNPTEENIELRNKQINEGLKIHTCCDYGDSIETINIASKGIENKLRLMTKVYYKYPDFNHRRFRPIINQLDEIIKRLGFLPAKFEIQICCYCSLNELFSLKAEEFFLKLKNDFGISKIYLETYPIYKYKIEDIILLNQKYKGLQSFGLSGYQNLLNRVFRNEQLKKFAKYSIDTCFIGILGKGVQNKVFIDSLKLKKNDFDNVDINLIKFILNIKQNKKVIGITSVSTLKQYENLKSRFFSIAEICDNSDVKKLIDNISHKEINFYENFDLYGGFYPLKTYFKKPKIIFSKFRYKLKLLTLRRKNSNNFFM